MQASAVEALTRSFTVGVLHDRQLNESLRFDGNEQTCPP
jgi:hypothetical protein